MGRVPTHWEILSLGQVGTLTKGTGGNKEDELPSGMPCVRYGDLYTTHKYFVENARSFIAPEVADQYTKIKFGDVLFAASGETADEIGKSAVNLLRGPAYCGGDVILFRPHGHLIPRYTGYMMDCEPIVHQKATMGRGFTVYHIYGKQLKYLRIPIPPPEEQAAIVRFLDHADEQIQRYIAGKERLIALLEEERQALVHQAVTRGLDPSVRLKPSGVEWMGDVPEHWEMRRLGQCTSVSGGATPSMEVNRFWGGSVPWVTPKDMKKDVISDSSMKVTDAAIHETSLQLVEPPVVLMVVRGMILARRVPIAYTTTPVTINQDMKALRTLRGTDAIFLAYSLNSVQEAFKPLIDEAGHGTRRLPTERWRELPITMPPPSEQRAIIEYLDNTKAEINAAIDRSRRQIDLMNEYRTRLIADVVTGQLDVREAAAQLPAAP